MTDVGYVVVLACGVSHQVSEDRMRGMLAEGKTQHWVEARAVGPRPAHHVMGHICQVEQVFRARDGFLGAERAL